MYDYQKQIVARASDPIVNVPPPQVDVSLTHTEVVYIKDWISGRLHATRDNKLADTYRRELRELLDKVVAAQKASEARS